MELVQVNTTRHRERSAAIHGFEFGLMDCHAALAVTEILARIDGKYSRSVTKNVRIQ